MYRNLENILKPPAQRDGRTLTLAAIMILLIGFLAFMTVRSGATWESDKRMFLMLAALAVFFIAAIPLGRLRTRRNIRKNFASFTESQLRRIDMECGDTAPLCGVVVTSHALACESQLIPIPDIVWIYEQNSTQRGVATINYLIVIDKDKKQRRIPLSIKAGPLRKADPEAVREITEQLLKRSPGIYCGYSDEIMQLYRRDFAGMVACVDEKYAQMHSQCH